jgi:hypothetical protein
VFSLRIRSAHVHQLVFSKKRRTMNKKVFEVCTSRKIKFSSSRSHFCRRLQQAADIRFRKPCSLTWPDTPPAPPRRPGPLDQFHSRRLAWQPLRQPRPPRVGIQIPLLHQIYIYLTSLPASILILPLLISLNPSHFMSCVSRLCHKQLAQYSGLLSAT